MLTALILLCPITIAPADCDRDSATDVFTVQSDMACTQPQQVLASLAIHAGEGHYWRIVCGEGR